ncbi:MAG: hypothetical protein AAFX04_00495 [Pseudomonadota bacterium]
MVAFADKSKIDSTALFSRVETYLEEDDPEPQLTDTDYEDTRSFIITIGPYSVLAIFMPFAIPTETLADAFGNELVWKAASSEFDKARSHLLLAVMNSTNNHAEADNQARLLTLVTNCAAQMDGGLGVYWPSSESVFPPAAFEEGTRAMLAQPEFPPQLWFSVRFFPGPDYDNDGRIVCQSRGLDIFMDREIECGPYDIAPGPLAETVFGVARFMAQAGPIFADGHTFGFGENDGQDARLDFRWSPLGGVNKPVYGLVLLGQEGA